jgi:sugar (pentulose or hexulose) kinase
VSSPVFLGIDIGTSGIRGCCIDENAEEITSHHIAFASSNESIDGRNEQAPEIWLQLLDELLIEISRKLKQAVAQRAEASQQSGHYQVRTIAIDGTSSTLIACSKDGNALSPALMYNDQQCQQQAAVISRFAPAECGVHGASSSLAKALFLLQKYPETEMFCHQADWLAAALSGRYGISDENNCLKLGYDSVEQEWPRWLQQNTENAVIPPDKLPLVKTPGSVIGRVKPALIEKYLFAKDCMVVAGTTDSNAAVLATGANQIGDAVTSLGSTLVIKLFSEAPLFAPEYGIYSHRLNGHWLVGGASNSGGCVLLQYFTQAQLDAMTPQLDPEQSTGLNYYPLPGTGERFPLSDSNKQSRVTPRPASDVVFFQALLEGIASIEAEGYKKLEVLGASPPQRIFTAGGGSKNSAWNKIRQRTMGIEVLSATHSEACYGSALLARQGYFDR